MSGPADAVEQRKIRAIAREYERGGYRVIVPGQGRDLPAFLQGLTPDLIAESEKDRVVIEVKRSNLVRGSNELQEIAEHVSREPGWRFELVTIPPLEQVALPTAERMDYMESRARQAMNIGLADVAYAYAWTAIEELLSDLALQHGLKVSKASSVHTARDLVSRGVISREALDTIEQARTIRNLLVHAQKEILPSTEDVEKLLALGRHLRGEVAAAATG
jgi:uncharacterized protein YutE (UPF0331/DUF86 family)